MKKGLLTMGDLSRGEILTLLETASDMKKHPEAYAQGLAGKRLGMIFQKSSTRTRVSFECGMLSLGGAALFLSASELQMGRGEPIRDTARVLSRYLDILMIRTYKQSDVEELAAFSSIPVINALTDVEHPCQILADLQTIQERFGRLEGLTVAYIGDGNNVCRSLIVGTLTCGMRMRVACPEGYDPDPTVLKWAEGFGDAFSLMRAPEDAAKGADVLVTDVWASMGQEGEAQIRQRAFAGYQINDTLMAAASDRAIVLHCLPAHRGEEITEEVFERFADVIFDEAENRMHAQKSLMWHLLGGTKA